MEQLHTEVKDCSFSCPLMTNFEWIQKVLLGRLLMVSGLSDLQLDVMQARLSKKSPSVENVLTSRVTR